jgi:hypothetical protein
MDEPGRLFLPDQSLMIYNEMEARSEALFNATLMWVPISSVMWAAIIYTTLWLFR